MDIGGIAALSLLGALACPLLLVVGIVSRWVPWQTLAATVRRSHPRRVR